MSQPARRERRACWHIVCMLPSILWSMAVNLAIVDQNRRALCFRYAIGFSSLFLLACFFFFFCEATEGGGRALTMGKYMSEVQRRLLAAWVVWGARLRRSRNGRKERGGCLSLNVRTLSQCTFSLLGDEKGEGVVFSRPLRALRAA